MRPHLHASGSVIISLGLFAVTSKAHTPQFVCIHAAHFVHWFFASYSREPYGMSKKKGQDLVHHFKHVGNPCSGDSLYSMSDTLLSPHLHGPGSPMAQFTPDVVGQRIYPCLFF